jgi:hypothetical protein
LIEENGKIANDENKMVIIIKFFVIIMLIVLLIRSFLISRNEGDGSLWDTFAGLSTTRNLLPVRDCQDEKVINQLLYLFYLLFGITMILVFIMILSQE